jgi:hypothetical protein
MRFLESIKIGKFLRGLSKFICRIKFAASVGLPLRRALDYTISEERMGKTKIRLCLNNELKVFN